MSDIPTDYRGQLDLRAVIAKIDRDRAETQKLQQASEKFVAEQRKLTAKSLKLARDRWLAPWLAVVGLIGGLITIASTIARWKGWGG
jgi:hypothetical protein